MQALRTIDQNTLREILDVQRRRFKRAGQKEDDAPEEDAEVPPEEDDGASAPGSAHPPSPDPIAYFAPSDRYRRPSDYVAHLTRLFEAGTVDTSTNRREPKPLKRDQALFVTQFAAACNAVWDDEQLMKEGALQPNKRRCFNFLLMGQGGSGKTAVVQEIVLPAMDFIFPAEEGAARSTLIVCAKWSQAENISTEQHKAVSCHRAGLVGIKSYKNSNLQAGEKKPALRRTWEPLKCLVLEEVSMISPHLYSMLLYRSFLGRAERWEIEAHEYDQLKAAFGRMPIVIHLGDFLQLKPTGTGGISLIADFDELAERQINLAVEFQSAMKLFCCAPLCFELQATNRFKEPRLRDLMQFMRHPAKTLPRAIQSSWESICLTDGDRRLRAERFQKGHMLAIYWETVSRWMMMRATRDAAALETPLFLLQAADASSPAMPMDVAAKLMNKAAPRETGGMHGLLPIHLGMRVRLLEALDLGTGLVKDAEGEVVHIVPNELDQDMIDDAFANNVPKVYLRHLPKGLWVRMDKYTAAPFGNQLLRHDPSLSRADTQSLVFVEARTSNAFEFRNYTVTRTGFPLSHAKVITATACQGRTMKEGVIIDCGRLDTGPHPKEDDDWWLDLYVMLSRATRLEDLLLMRAPPASFLLQGPPASLRKQLKKFAVRTETCRRRAEALAAELGLLEFLH